MKQANRQFKKTIALNTLILMIIGIFCVGMFMPMPGLAEAFIAENHQMGLMDDSQMSKMVVPEAICCVNRPQTNQAIIVTSHTEDEPIFSQAADVPTVDLFLPGIYYQNNFSLNILPPPEGEALLTIIKRE